MLIKVSDVVGQFCINKEQGQKIYNLIYPTLKVGKRTEVSFEKVLIVLPVFLNFAFKDLLRDIEGKDLKRSLVVTNLSDAASELYQSVMENDLIYYD